MAFDAKGEPHSDSVKKTLIVLVSQRQTGLIACLQDASALKAAMESLQHCVVEAVENELVQLKKESRKRECVAFASGKRARLIQSLRLSVDVIDPRALRVIDSEALPAFQWGPELSDDKQVEHNTKYLETHLKATPEEQGLYLMYAGAKSNLLNVVDARLPFDLSDTADLLIVRDLGRRTEENQHHLPGVRLVIELKKNMDNRYEEKEAQATGKLIAVNSEVPALCC